MKPSDQLSFLIKHHLCWFQPSIGTLHWEVIGCQDSNRSTISILISLLPENSLQQKTTHVGLVLTELSAVQYQITSLHSDMSKYHPRLTRCHMWTLVFCHSTPRFLAIREIAPIHFTYDVLADTMCTILFSFVDSDFLLLKTINNVRVSVVGAEL